MRKGKMIAQGAHASLKVFFDRMKCFNLFGFIFSIAKFTKEMYEWKQGAFTKICLSVDSEQELLDINNKAKEAKLPVALILDKGLTEFGGVPTLTCLAIGPANAEEIDKITGHLKLL